MNEIKVTSKAQLQREAELVALKRQSEWHDMPQLTLAQIQSRINQVQSFNTNNDFLLIAIKDLVLQHLSMRLQVRQMQDALTAKTLWAKVRRLVGAA